MFGKAIKKDDYVYIPLQQPTVIQVSARPLYNDPCDLEVLDYHALPVIKEAQDAAITAFIPYNKRYFNNSLTEKDIRSKVRSPIDGAVLHLDTPIPASGRSAHACYHLKLYGLRIYPSELQFRWKATYVESDSEQAPRQRSRAIIFEDDVHNIEDVLGPDERFEMIQRIKSRIQRAQQQIQSQIDTLQKFSDTLQKSSDDLTDLLTKPNEWVDVMDLVTKDLDAFESGFVPSQDKNIS